MNFEAVKSIYLFEMARMKRTLLQSVISPVLSTSLYFIVFGAAIGSRIEEIDGVQYGAFIVPGLILGGSFYSIQMLPEFWQKVTLANPVLYLISGFRWSFYETSDVSIGVSIGMISFFLAICLGAIWWIFRTGYRLKT